jgi:Domain of unknown function (DUF4372)/Transposase DDE domain
MVGYSSLFSQLLWVVNRHQFERRVKECRGEKAAKGFSCWSQFVAMMFCQLAQAKSLREISDGLACCEGKLNHLGLEEGPKRSTLSYANARRPWQLFERLFYDQLALAQSLAPKKKLRFKNKLLSLDATIIDLCLSMFNWATFRQTKGAVKLHLLLDHDGYLPVYAHLTEGNVHEMVVAKSLNFPKGSVVVMDRGYIDYRQFARWTKAGVFFLTRLKENANYWDFEDRPVAKNSHVLKDQLIRLNPITAGAPCREELRLVTVWDERNQCEVKLLTNQMQFAATTIAAIYRERWHKGAELDRGGLRSAHSTSRSESTDEPRAFLFRPANPGARHRSTHRHRSATASRRPRARSSATEEQLRLGYIEVQSLPAFHVQLLSSVAFP